MWGCRDEQTHSCPWTDAQPGGRDSPQSGDGADLGSLKETCRFLSLSFLVSSALRHLAHLCEGISMAAPGPFSSLVLQGTAGFPGCTSVHFLVKSLSQPPSFRTGGISKVCGGISPAPRKWYSRASSGLQAGKLALVGGGCLSRKPWQEASRALRYTHLLPSF